MMNTWIIGLTGLVHRFVSIAFIATTLFVSCAVSSTPRNKYHSTYDAQLGIHLYESVEEWPKYNNEPYAIGLFRMFNKTFSYIREENEQIQTRVAVELIISKKGELLLVRPLQDCDSPFILKALDVLRSCSDWAPGRIRGKPVNTKIIWQIVW